MRAAASRRHRARRQAAEDALGDQLVLLGLTGPALVDR